ncbi:MAG: hypothetical protein O2944_02595 [Proteobacteria bacterium]|nr:hypothetical protein [Pseudomonadota bacterium]
MSREARQRAWVSRLIMLNFVGVLIAGPYAGYLSKLHRDPWIAVAAVVLMFFGIVAPIYRLYSRMRADFDIVQSDTVKMLRRIPAETGSQEVFGQTETPERFRNARSQPLLTLLITVAGWGLLLFDVGRLLFG